MSLARSRMNIVSQAFHFCKTNRGALWTLIWHWCLAYIAKRPLLWNLFHTTQCLISENGAIKGARSLWAKCINGTLEEDIGDRRIVEALAKFLKMPSVGSIGCPSAFLFP